MMTPMQLVTQLDAVFNEANIEHPYFQSWWNDLKDVIADEFPVMTAMMVGAVYEMDTKKGRVTAVCTKENQKTWVVYEVEGSRAPGCRWMLYKTWCSETNIWRAVSQSYTLPTGVLLK